MGNRFHSTRWTLVLRSHGESEEAKTALSELCEGYYEPVIAFLLRDGRNEDAAREMAHRFFQQVLSGGLGQADPTKGKFRTYLLGALKNFLYKQHAAGNAAKRGGTSEHVEWTEGKHSPTSESSLENSATSLNFDRDWAFALIERSLRLLESELAHKPAFFQTLKPWLQGQPDIPQSQVAETLGLSTAATKVAIHRLRARFRELLRSEVAATVSSPQEAQDELRHLIAVASNAHT